MTYDTGWTQPPAPQGYAVEERSTTAGPLLRVFQVLTAVAGGALFVIGLLAVVRVDFGAGFFATSGDVAGFGFSPAMAVAGIILGALTLVASLASQDRAGAAFAGFLTLAVGIAGLIADGQVAAEVEVDRRSAVLFIALGAIVFVLALVPWWAGRRRTTVVRG